MASSTALKLTASVIIAVFIFGEIAAQSNNGAPTLDGTVSASQIDCATFLVSAFYEDTCTIPTQSGPFSGGINLSVCDSHCRCVHGAQWGQCIQRPTGGSIGTLFPGLTKQMCECYYTPPPSTVTNQIDLAVCAFWKTSYNVINLCNFGQRNVTSGTCSSDCYCGHNFQKGGFCDATTQMCMCNH